MRGFWRKRFANPWTTILAAPWAFSLLHKEAPAEWSSWRHPGGPVGTQPGGAAPRSGARAFASWCLPPPGNPPASRLALLASERGAAGTGPMGVGDSAGCGCQGRGPTSSILSSPAAVTRGLDADATGRAGMEAARCAPGPGADRSGEGAKAVEGRVGSPGWAADGGGRDRVPRMGGRCASRAASTLSCRSLGVSPGPARPAPPGSPIPSLAMRSPFTVSLWSRVKAEVERGPSWESKRKVAGDG